MLNINQVIEGSFDYHAFMGKKWRDAGKQNQLMIPLLYGALEYRLAIERFVFELYYLMNKDKLIINNVINEEQLKRISRFKSLVSVLHEDTGNRKILRRCFLYNHIHFRVLEDLNFDLAIPNIGTLDDFWQRLSDICHYQPSPNNSWYSEKWISRNYKLLDEIEDYIYHLVIKNKIGYINPSTMPTELKELRLEFIKENINEDSLKRRLLIMKPIIASRFKRE